MESSLEPGIRGALASVGLTPEHIEKTIALLYKQGWFKKAEEQGYGSGSGAAAPAAAKPAATDPVKKARLQELAAMPFPGGGAYGELTTKDMEDILDDRSMFSDVTTKGYITEMRTLLGEGYTLNSGGRRAQRKRGRRTVKRRATRGKARRRATRGKGGK